MFVSKKIIGVWGIALLGVAYVCPAAPKPAAPAKPAPATETKKEELLQEADPKAPKPFTKPTKEENEEAIASAKKFGKRIEEKTSLKFTTLETTHFIVFTDWDPREHAFLKRNVEMAYNAVAQTLEQSTAGSVFVGKLPVFMFSTQKSFQDFAKDVSGFEASKGLLGYYLPVAPGYGYLAMWKPDVKKHKGDVAAAEKDWATTLVHEFTHAFIARYRTPGHIPVWLNEGIAEIVSYRQFPRQWIYGFVRDRAKGKPNLDYMFEAKKLPGDDYPVAQTMVETLVAADSRAFLRFLNDIKDGMTAADALKKHYKKEMKDLDPAWRKYIQTVK